MTTARRTVAAVLIAAVAGVGAAGCSSSHHSNAGATPAAPVVRWWSDGAASAGSTIDPANPAGAASKLSSSRDTYCQMLRDTVASGRSILDGVSAQDPGRYTAAVAFLGELQRVAPTQLSAAWSVLSAEILTFVKTAGTLPSQDPAAAAKAAAAAQTVSADATAHCGVNLAAKKK